MGGTVRRRWRISRRQSLTWLLLMITGAAGAVAASVIFGDSVYPVGPFQWRVEWTLSWPGISELVFPPLGSVSAKTHVGPARLVASLESVDFQALAELIAAGPKGQEEGIQTVVEQGMRAARLFAVRLVVLGAAGGALASGMAFRLLGRRKRYRYGVGGGLIGALCLALSVGLAWTTYDPAAFRSPTYRGSLESIPWVIDAVQEALAQGAELEARLRTLARNVYEMYQRIDELPPPFAVADSDVTILHVSDFHNHPAAAGIARELAVAFDVDFAVNTGDLTDFGTRIEAELVQGLREFPVPQYLVTGNHETPEIVGALSLIEGLSIIDGRLVDAAGLRLLGIGDPGAASPAAKSMTPAEAKRMADDVNRTLEDMPHPPDIVAVHNHRVGSRIRPGSVPLVLFGHSHAPGVTYRGGTAYVNAGTTGGAGVRGLETEEPVRISLAVIYLERGESVRVRAVDIIRLSPVAEGFTLERHLAPAS